MGTAEEAGKARGVIGPEQLAMLAPATADALGLYRVEGPGRYRHEYLDPRAMEGSGYTAEQVVGRLFDEIFPEAVARRFHAAADEAVRERRTVRYLGTTHFVSRLKDLEVTVTPIFLDGVTQLVTAVRDVSDRMALERQREATDRKLRKLMEHAPDMIWLLGVDGTILDVTPAIESLLGYRPEELIGRPSHVVLHPDGAEEAGSISDAVWQTTSSSPLVAEAQLQHRDGSMRWVEATYTNLTGDPDIGAIVVNCHDITERKLVAERLAHEALHDNLTGLPNRALVSQRIDAMAGEASGTDRTAAVLYVDFDGFKLINDTFGHDHGDAMIRAAARRLEAVVGARGWVARMGGDEFIVVASELTSVDRHLSLAADIRASLADPFEVNGSPIYLTASIGLATTCDGVTLGADEMLRRADMAMYEAKRRGHNSVQVFDESLREQTARRLDTRNGLRRAIEESQFRLEYQAIFSNATRAVSGVEALLRWDHPTRGTVMPGAFIDVAEETGLIIPIGDWVLDAVCRQLGDWNERGFGRVQAALNVSPKQLLEPDFLDKVRASVARAHIDPAQLVIEITENLLMEDPAAAREVLQQLAELGIGCAIDDFGMGYSSLSYLTNLPATVLKIDRTFVAALDGHVAPDELGHHTALVAAIIGMAHALGLEVVAEGVETELQLVELRRLGCDHSQGFHLARPAPPTEIEALLRPAESVVLR